jgi:hypothetical protein
MANSLLPLMNQTTADLEMPDESPSAGVGIIQGFQPGACLIMSIGLREWANA